MRLGRPMLVVLLATLVTAAGATTASATTLGVDFESGPALGTVVTDEYLSTAFTRFVAEDDGFRPYRRSAPGLASSGSVVADVGSSDVCFAENPGNAGACEFYTASFTGRLTRTARSVTLRAGLFMAPNDAVTVRLLGFDAGDQQVAAGDPVAVDAAGFDAPVSVTDAAGRITRYQLVVEGPGALGAQPGIDDLTFDFPAGSLPDFSMSASGDTTALLQGRTTDVPLHLTRINGSSGNIDFTVTGLPPGVSGAVVPDPLGGTGAEAVLRLTPAADAATFEVPRSVTVTADPKGNANVAQATRTVTVPVRLAANFELRTTGPVALALPQCAAVHVPLQIARDRSFSGTVTLAAENVPAGLQVSTVPQVFAPGGGFTIETGIDLSAPMGTTLPATLRLRASAPGAPDRLVQITLSRAEATATLETPVLATPQRLLPGTEVRIRGNGFCPGTDVAFYSGARPDAISLEEDGHLLRFRTPRNAKAGPLSIFAPGAITGYPTANPVDRVDTYPNTNGFAFPNFDYGHLSWGELTSLVGADDVFIKVNPCWPWGHCTVVTPIPNPLTEIEWAVIDLAMRSSGGHCFGISRTVQLLLAKKVGYTDFAEGATQVFDLPAADGPSSQLSSYLDSQHAGQATREFLDAYVGHGDFDMEALRREIGKGHPIISMSYTKPGDTLPSGHAVVAYDVSTEPDGTTAVWVYDNNHPATAGDPAALSKIVFDADGQHWSFAMAKGPWTGGLGDIFMMPREVIPDDPSLPGIGDLLKYGAVMIFGSDGGAARSAGTSTDARFVPPVDGDAVSGAAGTWVGRPGQKRISQKMEGVADGTYSQVVLGNGFAGAVRDVKTAKGVKDTITGATGTHELAFEGGRTRPLKMELLSGDGGDTARTATIETTTTGGGGETAALAKDGTLELGHVGGDAPLRFTLTDVRPDGGVTRFTSPALRIGGGDHLTARPGKGMDTVALVVRRRNGTRTTRTLRDRSRTRARLTVGRPTLRGRSASVTVRLARLPQAGTLGVALRAVKGRRTVGRATLAVNGAGNGRRTIRATLPKLAKGRYRLVADVTLVSAGSEPGAAKPAVPEVVRRSGAALVHAG